MITIGELFSRVVLPLENKTIIDTDLRILYLKKSIENIDIKKLGMSKQFSKLYTQGDFIFKFFNELNSEFTTIDELNTHDTYGFYEEHLGILNKIYQNYIALLEQNNFLDRSSLPLAYKINYDFLEEYKEITIFYEGYFSKFEFSIIQTIANYSQLEIQCTINKFNQKNIELFRMIGLELDISRKYLLDISHKKILLETKLKDFDTPHKIFPLSQRISQLAMIKYSISEMIHNGIDPSKIVLVLPDESFGRYIEHFDTEKYFNFAMGNGIFSTSTYQISYAINDYLNKDEPKYTKRIEYFNLDKRYIDEFIKVHWNKNLTKKNFFELFDFITHMETNEELGEKLLEIRTSLNNLLFSGMLEDTITLKDGFHIFLKKLSEITLDDIHSGKITVIGILETRFTQYDGVIVIDFNDSKVPKKSVKDKFISSNVKRFSNLPTATDRENLQKYYYQKLFDNAKEIYISYVVNKENTMSRFINELFEKPNCIEVDFSAILKNNTEFKFIPKSIIKEINLSHLEWSATSLKTFLDCKRKYYYQNILKIEEHSITLKPKGYELGNIIHTILEKICKEKRYNYQEMTDEISKYQNQNPYLTIELELWKKKLERFFINEHKRLASGIEIYELEKSFRIEKNGITLKGKIDRIDRLADGSFAILDYKTSANLKIDTFKTYENTSDFQLEFYFLATKELGVSQVGYYDLNSGEIKEEVTLEVKLEKLDAILKSFDTKEVDFAMCQKEQICEYCPYTILCGI